MPRDDACNHPNCYGEPCKQLTNEELQPTEHDIWSTRRGAAVPARVYVDDELRWADLEGEPKYRIEVSS